MRKEGVRHMDKSKEHRIQIEDIFSWETWAARERWKKETLNNLCKLFMWIEGTLIECKKKCYFDTDGNRNTLRKKILCTTSKAPGIVPSFCCFAAWKHSKENWNQSENPGNQYNCLGRALPIFGTLYRPKRVFICERAAVKQ